MDVFELAIHCVVVTFGNIRKHFGKGLNNIIPFEYHSGETIWQRTSKHEVMFKPDRQFSAANGNSKMGRIQLFYLSAIISVGNVGMGPSQSDIRYSAILILCSSL